MLSDLPNVKGGIDFVVMRLLHISLVIPLLCDEIQMLSVDFDPVEGRNCLILL